MKRLSGDSFRLAFRFRRVRALYAALALFFFIVMLLVFSTRVTTLADGTARFAPRFFFSIAVVGAWTVLAPLLTVLVTFGAPLFITIPRARKEEARLRARLVDECDIESFATTWAKNRSLFRDRARDSLVVAEISFYRGDFRETQSLASTLTLEAGFTEEEHDELLVLMSLSACFADPTHVAIPPVKVSPSSLLFPLSALTDATVQSTPLAEWTRKFLDDPASCAESPLTLCYHNAYHEAKENRYGEKCLC